MANMNLPWRKNEYGTILNSRGLEVVANGFATALGSGEYRDEAEELGDAIVLAVNHHDALVEALEEAERQIQYLRAKFGETGSGNAVLARVKDTLAAVRGQK